jgi:hypothetical protein
MVSVKRSKVINIKYYVIGLINDLGYRYLLHLKVWLKTVRTGEKKPLKQEVSISCKGQVSCLTQKKNEK